MAMLKLLLRGLAFVTAGSFSWGASAQEINPGLSRARELIVMLETKVPDGVRYGAGIVIGRDEKRIYIATAGHVVRSEQGGPGAISVFFRPSPKAPFDGVVLPGRESGVDLAVVGVSPKDASGIDKCGFPFDTLRGPPGVKRGEDVLAIGNPNGSAWVIPVLPDKFAGREGDELVFQSSFVTYGNSGGALVDRVGRLVGMVTKDQPPFGRALDIDALLRLVRAWGTPVELFTRTASGGTALHTAAEAGDLAAVRKLRQSCIGVNESDRRNATALHFAASNGRAEVILELVRAGADLEARDVDGDTPLMLAAEKGQLESARALISAKANVNAKRPFGPDGACRPYPDRGCRDYPPLYVSLTGGYIDLSRLLLQSGAQVRDEYLSLAMHHYSKYTNDSPNVPILEALIRAGAKPDKFDFVNVNLLSLEALSALLLTDRRIIETKAHEGLLRAIEMQSADRVNLFLASGVRPHRKPDFPESPIGMAIRLARSDGQMNPNILDALLRAGADVNELDEYGGSPLLGACGREDRELVNYLIQRGGQMSNSVGFANRSKDRHELRRNIEVCLWSAIQWGDAKFVQLLLSNGVPVTADLASTVGLTANVAIASERLGIRRLLNQAKLRGWP